MNLRSFTPLLQEPEVFSSFSIKKSPRIYSIFWKTLDLVTIIDEKDVEECHRMKNDYVYAKEKHKKYVNPDRHLFKAGSQMLARKDY